MKNFEIAFKLGAKMDPSVKKTFYSAQKELSGFGKGVGNVVRTGAKVVTGIGTVAVGTGAAIAGAAWKLSEANAKALAMSSQFGQVFGDLEKNASNSLNKIAKDTGMLPNRLKGSFTQMSAFAKTTGMDTADALALTERATFAAADSAAFYDRSIEDVSENLQSFLKGNYENDAALGISATETTRNAKATELYGKSFKNLSEAQKQLTLLAMVEDGNKLSGALGQAARESDAWENQLGNLRQSWTDLQAKLGKSVLPIVIDKMKNLSGVLQNVDTETLAAGIEKFANKVELGIDKAEKLVGVFKTEWLPGIKGSISTGLNYAKNFYSFISNNWSTIKPILIGLVGALVILKGAMVAMSVIQTVTGFLKLFKAATLASKLSMLGLNGALLANPMTWVVAGIMALIAVGVLLYKNWDTVKEKAGQVWDALVGVIRGPANSIIGFANGIISAYEAMINFVGGAINKIPSISLPEWLGGGEFGIPKIPTVSLPRIPMLAEGAITTGPTLAMIGEGLEQEAVLPLSKLQALLDGPTDNRSMQIVYSPQINIPEGARKKEIEDMTKVEFEKFKAWIKKYLDDKDRKSF
jgi:hypothetical protein